MIEVPKAQFIYRMFCDKDKLDIVGAVYAGMIEKKDLVDEAWYIGYCRNASEAKWSSRDQKFHYVRYKFGTKLVEDIRHPEDDEGYDVFVPVEKKDE